jgi:phosphate starvation-inducible PhoH-like protein
MCKLKAHNDKDLDLKNNKDRDRMYMRFSPEQKEMFRSIKENTFTFCEACAGAGKTLVSVAAMLDMLANDEIGKIVYIQKVSQRYLQHGFLPGNIEEKTEALWQPFYDAMLTLGYTPYNVDSMIDNGLIILTTDSTLRGINLKNVGLIVDEAQNCDWETLMLIFTRPDDDCHVAMLGDVKQKDNKGKNNIFIEYGNYLAEYKSAAKCILTKNYRGDFSRYAEQFIPSCLK